MSNYSKFRWCCVRDCKNTGIKTPDKLWIQVPTDKNRRKTWLEVARRDPEKLSQKTRLYFCEDHFDLEHDMVNYVRYKIMGSVKRVRIKPHCIPTKFSWNKKHESDTSSSLAEVKSLTKSTSEDSTDYSEIKNEEALSPYVKEEMIEDYLSDSYLSDHETETARPDTNGESDALLVCRGCLATGVKMLDLETINLKGIFEELVGKSKLEAYALCGHHLCSYCVTSLVKFTQFRDRCRRTENLLLTLQNIQLLNADTIKSIDRSVHKLNINLSISKPTIMESVAEVKNENDEKAVINDILSLNEEVMIKSEADDDDEFAKEANLDISSIHDSIDLKEEYDDEMTFFVGNLNDKMEIEIEKVTNNIVQRDIVKNNDNSVDFNEQCDSEIVSIEETVCDIENTVDKCLEQLFKCSPKDKKILFVFEDGELSKTNEHDYFDSGASTKTEYYNNG